MEVERLPLINILWEVDQGLSNEWDLFWLTPEESKLKFFEVYPDFRKNKLIFIVESQNR